nr:translational initiation factor 1 [Trema domingense]
MVIFLISELYTELFYFIFVKKKEIEKGPVSNITPPTLVNPSSERTKKVHEGLIYKILPDGILYVSFYYLTKVYRESLILGYVSGRIRHNFFIHILSSVDRVKIEESQY